MTIGIFFLIILHEICSTIEQILFKKGANNLSAHGLKKIRDYLSFMAKILCTPVIWLGFLMIAAAWAIWFIVLAKLELSVAVPVDSMQYIMILLASYFFLGERMHWTRILGTLSILVGVLFVATS